MSSFISNTCKSDRLTIKAQEALQAAQHAGAGTLPPTARWRASRASRSPSRRTASSRSSSRNSASTRAASPPISTPNWTDAKVQGASQVYPSAEFPNVLTRREDGSRRSSRTITSAPSICCWGCSTRRRSLKKIFRQHGLKRDAVLRALAELRGNQRVTDPNPEDKFQALEKYGRDLTALARQGKIDPVIGRDEEIRRVMQVLTRRTKNNPVLIGEPGVGKTAIAEGLARRIVSGDVPETLKNKRLVAMDLERDDRRRQVSRRVRGPAQGVPQGDRRPAKARSSCSSTSCTRSSARARRKGRRTRRTS